MQVNRRDFMKVSGAGVVGLSMLQLGVDVRPVRAYADTLKIEGAKEVVTICPFCSVSCHVISHVKDGKLVSTEGDPDYPINQGALCAKGASMLSMTRNEHRLTKPRAAPGGRKRAGIGPWNRLPSASKRYATRT